MQKYAIFHPFVCHFEITKDNGGIWERGFKEIFSLLLSLYDNIGEKFLFFLSESESISDSESAIFAIHFIALPSFAFHIIALPSFAFVCYNKFGNFHFCHRLPLLIRDTLTKKIDNYFVIVISTCAHLSARSYHGMAFWEYATCKG